MTRKLKKWLLLLLTMMMVLCMGTVSNAASIKLNKKKVTLYVTQTTTLKVTGTTKKVKWSSSDKKIAKVSQKGKVTAVKAGKATITAKVGKKSLKCTVTVKKGLNKKSVTLEVGKKETLKLYGTKIKSVKTSKKSVATISKSGKITAKKAGKCTVTITGKDGKKYTCKVTVVKAKAAETEAPQTEAPQTEAPQTEAPQTEAAQTEISQTEAPETEASQTEAEQTEAAQTEDIFAIKSITGSGVLSYIVKNGVIRIYVTKDTDTLDLSSLIITANENVTVTVTKNTDNDVYTVVMTADETQSYKYTMYLQKGQILECDEAYAVSLDSDNSAIAFIFTPTVSGTYRFAVSGEYDDVYMTLDDADGKQLTSKVPKFIYNVEIAFEYDLSAGQKYYYIVSTGDGDNVSGTAILTYEDEAVSTAVAATQELAVSAELYIDLFAEETSVQDEVEISETQEIVETSDTTEIQEIVETSDTTETLNAAGTEAQEDELDIMKED